MSRISGKWLQSKSWFIHSCPLFTKLKKGFLDCIDSSIRIILTKWHQFKTWLLDNRQSFVSLKQGFLVCMDHSIRVMGFLTLVVGAFIFWDVFVLNNKIENWSVVDISLPVFGAITFFTVFVVFIIYRMIPASINVRHFTALVFFLCVFFSVDYTKIHLLPIWVDGAIIFLLFLIFIIVYKVNIPLSTKNWIFAILVTSVLIFLVSYVIISKQSITLPNTSPAITPTSENSSNIQNSLHLLY